MIILAALLLWFLGTPKVEIFGLTVIMYLIQISYSLEKIRRELPEDVFREYLKSWRRDE